MTAPHCHCPHNDFQLQFKPLWGRLPLLPTAAEYRHYLHTFRGLSGTVVHVIPGSAAAAAVLDSCEALPVSYLNDPQP